MSDPKSDIAAAAAKFDTALAKDKHTIPAQYPGQKDIPYYVDREPREVDALALAVDTLSKRKVLKPEGFFLHQEVATPDENSKEWKAAEAKLLNYFKREHVTPAPGDVDTIMKAAAQVVIARTEAEHTQRHNLLDAAVKARSSQDRDRH